MAGCLEVVPRYYPLGSWQGSVGISQVLYSQSQKDCAWSECVEHLYGLDECPPLLMDVLLFYGRTFLLQSDNIVS